MKYQLYFRDDCMKLFTECSENFGPEQVELFCERLSPSSNDSCLSLSTFIDSHEPGIYVHDICSVNIVYTHWELGTSDCVMCFYHMELNLFQGQNCDLLYTIYGKSSEEESFCAFCSFSDNNKSFTCNCLGGIKSGTESCITNEQIVLQLWNL